MKWIGQHIYDLVARFRNDVYLEDLSTTTETNVLVVDSDGKVSKTTVITGDVTGVTAGSNITVTDPTGPVPTVALNTSLTGLTSITSTSFVGTLTGTASGNLVSGGALGTPSSGDLTNCTFPTLNQSTTGNADTATKIASITNSDIVQLDATQTLTLKTLFRPTIENYAAFEGGTSGRTYLKATAVAGATTLTLPAATDTLVGKATIDILTNKTLTSPVINSPTGLVKGDVGLGSVDDTADTAKPVSTAQQTALDLKANVASPTFTGKISLNDGGYSVFVGEGAGLNDDASANLNVGVGRQALYSNTTGANNSAVGYAALYSNTTGSSNTANGYAALSNNAIGLSNTANGASALYSNTTGSFNTALGTLAGAFIADGVTANTVTNNSVFLGTGTKALADSQTNQIVIGYDTTGLGSNTAILGNSSITTTRLQGGIEINASDTTITRAEAGRIAVEGVNVVTTSSTDTLTNKTLRRTVVSKDVDYELEASDAGKVILMAEGGVDITIPANVFTAGDEFTIINSSGSPTACLVKTNPLVTMFVVGTAYLSSQYTLPARRGLQFICEVGGASPRFYGWRS
jgi:hypothetical protein